MTADRATEPRDSAPRRGRFGVHLAAATVITVITIGVGTAVAGTSDPSSEPSEATPGTSAEPDGAQPPQGAHGLDPCSFLSESTVEDALGASSLPDAEITTELQGVSDTALCVWQIEDDGDSRSATVALQDAVGEEIIGGPTIEVGDTDAEVLIDAEGRCMLAVALDSVFVIVSVANGTDQDICETVVAPVAEEAAAEAASQLG